jgi:hypothetical protein
MQVQMLDKGFPAAYFSDFDFLVRRGRDQLLTLLSKIFCVTVGYKRIAFIYANSSKCLKVLRQCRLLTELAVYAVDLFEGKHNYDFLCLLLYCRPLGLIRAD